MGRQNVDQFPINNSGGQVYGLTWLPQTYNSTARRYPLIIFLHGSGETGTTVSSLSKLYTASPRSVSGRIADGWNAVATNPLTGVQDSFIVVSPQAATWSLNYTELKHVLPSILSRYRVDTTRIYLTGLSAGGGGVFSTFGSRDSNFIKQFAAMATASSAGTNASNGYTAEQVEAGLRFGSRYGVSMWTIAGDQDYLLSTDVRYHDSTNMLLPTLPNKLTVITGVGHSAWGRAFDPAFRPTTSYYGRSGNCTNGCNNGGIPVVPNANGSAVRGTGKTQDSLNLYEWLLLSKRTTAPVANQFLTVVAGSPVQITLPISFVTLSGTATPSAGYAINSYSWSKVAGPSQFTITTPLSATTTVTNLVQGTYQFVLRVTDNSGASATDTITVTVSVAANQAPVANAGTNQTITLPANSVTLNGTGTDADGTIAAYQWTKISGPSQFTITAPTQAATTVTNLAQGTYSFELRVTDNSGAIGRDTVQVSVNAVTTQSTSSCGGKSYTVLPVGDGGYYNSLNLQPGDTLFLDSRYTYYYVYLANRHGTPSCPIVVMNKGGQVKIQGGHLSQISLYNCSYVKVIGTGSPTDTYGFRIQPYPSDSLINGSFAFSVTGRSKNIEVSNLHISNAGTGMNIKEDGGCDPQYNFPNWVMDSISIHDNKIVKTWNQGMYIGNTSPDNGPSSYSPRPVVCNGVTTYPRPPRMGNIKVYNNIVDSTGRAGIQLASASTGISEIYNNTVRHSGMSGDDAQGAGITIGSYTKAYVHHNTIINTYTCGIASMGGSGTNVPLRIENNVIDSSGFLNSWILWTSGKSSIRISSEPVISNSITWPYSIFLATKPTLNTDSTQFWIKSNSLGIRKHPTGGIGLADYVATFQKTGNFICNNVNSFGGVPNVIREEVTPVIYNTNCTDNQNWLPVANAGNDQSIVLPVNTVTVTGNGADADGTITSYQWSKVSGPTQFTVVSPSQPQTVINNLVQGTYLFELRVTDNSGATGRDTMQVTVNAAPAVNQAPVANAGANQTITLPANSVTLNGSGTDADGTIAGYQWTKIGGPSSGSITNPALAQTTVTSLAQGVYLFELRITDNNGAVGRDTMQVTVNPAPVANQAPVANAGANQTITLPATSVTLNGSGTDTDGTIAGYQWTKIGGPSSGSILNPSLAQTNVSALIQGVYLFELRVTDNNGAVGRDTIQVTVNAANLVPVALAGEDQVVILPASSSILSGTGIDTDGSIAAYQWTKVSGPDTFEIVSPSQPTTVILNLVKGTYQFVLTVTDNKGATATDTVLVTVKPSDNTAEINVSIYPNPAVSNTILLIEAPTKGTQTLIRIYTRAGALVYQNQVQRDVNQFTLPIDVSTFQAGMYLVYVNIDPNTTRVVKLIKQ